MTEDKLKRGKGLALVQWLGGDQIWLSLGEMRTPSLPRPGVFPNSATVRFSSFWRTDFLVFSVSVAVGKACIHFCITVHKLGVAFPGVMALMASIACFERLRFGVDRGSGSPISGSSKIVAGASVSAIRGSRACHSPSRRATARQTSSRLRSSGLQTWPRMNLYMRPFWKRARSGGARLCWARSECEAVSPVDALESSHAVSWWLPYVVGQ